MTHSRQSQQAEKSGPAGISGKGINTYLVGGAVRDKLLGYPVREKDWVVTGATPDQMRALGFRQVGRDFPVFLHPETGEEYALARTERKTGSGYGGFTVDANPSVTLEEDLLRRDLTINAIAEDTDGTLMDPFNGQEDIKRRLLRHVSPAFAEDPLRVLRVARFLARYHHLGFTLAPETAALMTQLSESGELAHLTPERIWQETHKALSEKNPEQFFLCLRKTGALKNVFPEIDRLFGVPQPPEHHPEIDTGEHTLLALKQACLLTDDTRVRFAVLLHDLGKGTTPVNEWPRHIAHEKRGVPLINELCQRIRPPKIYHQLAVLVCEFHTHCHQALSLKPATLVKTLERLDAFRQPERFENFLLACEADARGRTDLESRPYPQADWLRAALEACRAISIPDVIDGETDGKKIHDRIHRARIRAVSALNKPEHTS